MYNVLLYGDDRRSKKKRGADSLSLERETTALRDELTAMADDSEVDVVSTLDVFLITDANLLALMDSSTSH